MISFSEMYEMLEKKGPGRAVSSKGTVYRVEARNEEIICFPKKGRVTICKCCWMKQPFSHYGNRTGGVYNGPYSIFDWYNEMVNK